MERIVTNRRSSMARGEAPAARKSKRFYEEASLLPYHRSRNQHYRNSGYDRGHLAPAADHAHSDSAMRDTFVLTNVSPQLPLLNRSMWLRLEEFARDVARAEETRIGSDDGSACETWVITGPLWLPSSMAKVSKGRNNGSGDGNVTFQYSYVGIGKPPSVVAVPTHFYKVLVVVDTNRKKEKDGTTSLNCADEPSETNYRNGSSSFVLRKFAAFVLPNSDEIRSGRNGGIRLVDFTVRLSDLEAVTGLEFFPSLFGKQEAENGEALSLKNDTISIEKEIADALTDDVRLHAKNEKIGDEKMVAEIGALSDKYDGEYLSKGRQRKIKQILCKNRPVPFEHLCKMNRGCFVLH